METLEMVRVGGACLDSLLINGWQVEQSAKFEAVPEVLRNLGKPAMTPIMEPSRNDFTQTNSFWLFAHDDEGPAACISARMDDVGEEGLGAFLSRSMSRGYPPLEGGMLRFDADYVGQQMRRKLVYIGELYVRKSARGNREALENLLMLTHSVAALKWQADWHYAFMRARDVKLGMDRTYWFTRRWPGVMEWTNPPEGRSEMEWLVAIPREDMPQVARYYLKGPKG